MTFNKQIFQQRLQRQPQWLFVAFAATAAFMTYSCMYAFRKAFTAATFDEMYFLGIHFKIWLITSQLIGYTLSKFIGIRLVSSMKPGQRATTILAVIGIAQLALLLFAITPAPWSVVWMFFNGLPLGVVWGLVFSYLEGRKTTEILGAAVSVSFIVSSGMVKSVGSVLLTNYGIAENWMPFVTGMLFTIPLLLSVMVLNLIPAPSISDVALRSERKPMNAADRKQFLQQFLPTLLPLTIIFVFLTVLRDIRDNFAAEIWSELGLGNTPAIFTTAELPIGVGVLVIISLMAYVINNKKALYGSIGIIATGFIISILATVAFNKTLISPVVWMISVGFGLYLSYITYHALLFERFLATFRQAGNIGFLFYFSDAIGYLGSVSTFLTKNFFSPNLSWVQFFSKLNIYLAITGLALCLVASYTIHLKISAQKKKTTALNGINIAFTQ